MLDDDTARLRWFKLELEPEALEEEGRMMMEARKELLSP
jgi:hypothetical protein